MRGQPLDMELKWTQECFSTPAPSYPGPTSTTVWGLFTPSWCPLRRRRGGDQCVSSRSSWRPPRAPKAVGALPMLFIALLLAPPISSTGHCSCASQASCLLLPQSSLISRPTSMLPGKTLPLSKCCQHQSISSLPRMKVNRSSFKSHFWVQLCTIPSPWQDLPIFVWSILHLLILVHHRTILACKKYL